MAGTTEKTAQPEHPAPHRHRVSPWSVWFGLLVLPLAWALQLAVNATLFGHGCYPQDVPLAEPLWPHLREIALAVEAVAALGCTAAGTLALRNWRRTRREKAGGEARLLGGGGGRTRFLAMVGMLLAALFLLAIALSTLNLATVTACGG